MTEPPARAALILRRIGTTLTRLPRPAGLLLAAAWAFVIWRMSAQEGGDAPHVFLQSWLYNSAHAPFFGLLAFLLAIALLRTNGWPRVDLRGATYVLTVILAYALFDEWHQAHVPGRDPDWSDIVTDLTGAAVTLWMIAWLGKPAALKTGLWPRIAAGLGLCLLGGLIATLRSIA